MHAEKQQQLLDECDEPPAVVERMLSELQAETGSPVVLHGPLGCGLQTIAAHLAAEELQRDPARMVTLRYLTLTPESQTVMAALFTVLEQVAIAFGGGSAALQSLKVSLVLLLCLLRSIAVNPNRFERQKGHRSRGLVEGYMKGRGGSY